MINTGASTQVSSENIQPPSDCNKNINCCENLQEIISCLGLDPDDFFSPSDEIEEDEDFNFDLADDFSSPPEYVGHPPLCFPSELLLPGLLPEYNDVLHEDCDGETDNPHFPSPYIIGINPNFFESIEQMKKAVEMLDFGENDFFEKAREEYLQLFSNY